MKIGRNAKCPCGSGKKYKKCCLPREKEKQRQALASREEPAGRSPEPEVVEFVEPVPARSRALPEVNLPHDDEEERWQRFWDEFRKASVDEKLALVHGIIEEEEFDGEMAFELVDASLIPLREAGRVKEAEQLLDLIAEQHPDAYEEEAGHFSLFRVENALITGGDVEPPLMGMVGHVASVIDLLFALVDHLRYFGKTRELARALAEFWPEVKDSVKILNYGKEELADITFAVFVDDLLEGKPDLREDNPDLLERLSMFDEQYELEHSWLEQVLTYRSGRSGRRWHQDDFAPAMDAADLTHNLYLLSLEFGLYLHRGWGWPRSRTGLASELMCGYLTMHNPNRPVGLQIEKRRKKRGLFDGPTPSPEVLLPRPAGVVAFMERLGTPFVPRPHQMAAFYLALSPWLNFLAEKDLVSAEESLFQGQLLREELVSFPVELSEFTTDTVLRQHVAQAWDAPPEPRDRGDGGDLSRPLDPPVPENVEVQRGGDDEPASTRETERPTLGGSGRGGGQE